MLLKGYSLTISDDSNMQYHLLIFSILLTYDWGWMSPWQRTVTNRGSSGSRPCWRSCSNISLTYLQCMWLSRMKGIWWAALFRILLLQLTDKLEFLYLLFLGWLWWGKILVTVSLEGKTNNLYFLRGRQSKRQNIEKCSTKSIGCTTVNILYDHCSF